MFRKISKKNIYVINCEPTHSKITQKTEWKIQSEGFFLFSPRPLIINEWYRIIYYQSQNGYYRLMASSMITNQDIKWQELGVIKIIDQDYKIRFYSVKYRKYYSYSCPDSCYNGKFCNNCLQWGENVEPSEVKNQFFQWTQEKKLLVEPQKWEIVLVHQEIKNNNDNNLKLL